VKYHLSGATPKSKGDAYVEEDGIPFIRSGDINVDDIIDYNNVLFIRDDVHNNQLKGSQLQKGDLLIAIVGATIGQVAVFNDEREANINQALAMVRLDPSKAIPQYVKLYFLTKLGQAELDRLKRPVARANINLDEIRSIRIVLPSIEKQIEAIQVWEKAILEKQKLEKQVVELLDLAKQKIETHILG
jgi:type I restriction enzyme, S subunit